MVNGQRKAVARISEVVQVRPHDDDDDDGGRHICFLLPEKKGYLPLQWYT